MTGPSDWATTDANELISLDLPDEQRELMVHALLEWGGPSRPTDAVARAMGFRDRKAMRELSRIRDALADRHPLSKRDWARALVATEIGFASAYYGAGCDWDIVTGWTDEYTIGVLRGLQRNVAGLRAQPHHRHDLVDPFADVDGP